MYRKLLLPLAALFFAACASTTMPVDMKEPRRVLGTESDVRLDALVYQDHLAEAIQIPVAYEITNHRNKTILVADIVPLASYDPETRTVTIDLGTEIPGESFLPRLIAIGPEQKKTFHQTAHVTIAARPGNPWAPRPDRIRIRLNFLGDEQPFQQLVEMNEKEKGLYDPKLAADLFPKWVEGNETVVTNTLPMRWNGGVADAAAPMQMGPGTPKGGRRSDRP
ncbi:MAG TPA: hypothetical protein VI670_11095 [Thermoanaerobaculia bacterium]